MSSLLHSGTRARTGAVLLLAGPLLSWLAELVTAAAWQNPPYAPLYNWISHLGTRGPEAPFGQVANSPLAWVMNTGWVAYGTLLIIGVLTLVDLRSGWRGVVLPALAVLSGVGVATVGLVHGSQESIDNGQIVLHMLGAQTVIATGNIFAIVAGASAARLGLGRGYARAAIALGTIGLISFVIFMVDARGGIGWNLGMFERGAVYPIMVHHALLGSLLLQRWAEARNGALSTSAPERVAAT